MFNRWIVFMLIVAAFSFTSCAAWKKDSTVSSHKHKAKPQVVFVNGRRLKKFLLEEYKNFKGEELLAEFRKELGVQRLTGFASLIGANLEGIRDNLQKRRNPTRKGDPACRQAYKEKMQWHLDHQGEVPEAFGKIVNYNVSRRSKDKYDIWVGRVDVCTWFYDKEYYVEMVFFITEDYSLRAFRKNSNGMFPGTFDLSRFTEAQRKAIMKVMEEKNWKLHAKGGSFGFITARENGVDMDKSSDLFKVDKDDCFDMFFEEYPSQASEGLPNQLDYCMGRCDFRIMNSSE